MFWFLLGVGALTVNAVAQLSVQVLVPHSNLLVYESIPVTVRVQNYSGRPIQLEDDGETRWLKFLVTDDSNDIVPVTGTFAASEPVTIAPGKAVFQTIDLLSLFALGHRGSYRVQATVSSSAGNALSAPVQFSLIHGREIWTKTVGLTGSRDEYRIYALVTRREGNDEFLFVSVREEPAHAMYSLVPLGVLLPTGVPQIKLDKQGHLHVLFQNGPRSFGCVHIDPSAKVIARAAYSDFITRPELVDTDGVVTVVGGEQTYPKSERILTEEEINPPPPPAPKPQKKWWWSSDAQPKPTESY